MQFPPRLSKEQITEADCYASNTERLSPSKYMEEHELEEGCC